MPVEYAEIDKKLVQSVDFRLYYDIITASDPSGIAQLASTAGVSPKLKFPIQFPPKITADNKSSNWAESASAGSAGYQMYNQHKMYRGAKDRQFGFELTYIADGGIWRYQRIKALAHFSKSLMYISNLNTFAKSGIKAPLLEIRRFYGAIETRSSWALESVDIKHSEKIINHGNNLFGPIRTDINFKCKEISGSGSLGEINSKFTNALSTLYEGVEKATTALWY